MPEGRRAAIADEIGEWSVPESCGKTVTAYSARAPLVVIRNDRREETHEG
jgi:hypothetical protein